MNQLTFNPDVIHPWWVCPACDEQGTIAVPARLWDDLFDRRPDPPNDRIMNPPNNDYIRLDVCHCSACGAEGNPMASHDCDTIGSSPPVR